jgi:hypothetical protein
MKTEQNNHLEDMKEFIKDCSYEDAAGEAYSHPQYITGFPMFLEDILYYLLKDISHNTNEENWTEGRYLILKHKEKIDKNFQKLLSDSNLTENLFKGIKDIENFKDFT